MVKTGGRREGEPMSLPWLQPVSHKGLRGVTGGREDSFEKLIFSSLQSHHATQRYYTCRPKVLDPPPEAFRRIVRRFQTVRPKPSDSQFDACELSVRRHGLNVSSICHRSLLFLCRQARIRFSCPAAADTCVFLYIHTILSFSLINSNYRVS